MQKCGATKGEDIKEERILKQKETEIKVFSI